MDISDSIEKDIKEGNIKSAFQKFSDIEKEKMPLSQKLIELKAKCFAEEDNLIESIKILESSPFTSNGELLKKYKLWLKIETNSPSKVKEQNDYTIFNKWLLENGAKFDKVRIVYYEQNYRGVHARKSIKEGEIVISIPSNLLIFTQKGYDSHFGSILNSLKYETDLVHLVYLALFMIEESQKENSFWRPYLNLIPASVDNIPLYYNEEEKKQLAGTRIPKEFEIDHYWFEHKYEKLIELCPEIKKISFDEIKLWMVKIMTRVFLLINCDADHRRALIPLADMLNHDSIEGHMVKWGYNNETENFEMIATRDIKRGETIYDSYGRKSQYRSLYFHGFIDDNNKLIWKYLEFELPQEIPNLEEKVNLLGKNSVELLFSNNFINSNRNLRQLTILRWLFDERDSNDMPYFPEISEMLDEKKPIDSKLKIEIISKSNEIQILKFLISVCENHLKGFNQAMEEDKQALENPKLTFNLRNIYILKYNKKKFLFSLIELCQKAIKFLDGTANLNMIDELKDDWGYSYYMTIKDFLLSNK